MTGLLIGQILISIILALVFLVRPAVTRSDAWKVLAFIGLAVLPALCIAGGMDAHVQRSEQTKFCISCHVMVPYGKSLYLNDTKFIPAQHFQNHRVPASMACISCHADYSLYGPFKDKLRGLTRIYFQYVGTTPDPASIRIPGGFNNGQCLHCHLGARNFEENPVHSSMMDSLKSDQMSCLNSGCHDSVHDIANLPHEKFWSPGQ